MNDQYTNNQFTNNNDEEPKVENALVPIDGDQKKKKKWFWRRYAGQQPWR